MDVNETSNNAEIAARREARRRKILENSKSRLTRITGREHTDENDTKTSGMYSIGFRSDDILFEFDQFLGTESDSQPNEQAKTIYPDPEIERDVYVPHSTTPFPPELLRDVDGLGSIDDQRQFFELFNSLNQQQQQNQQSTGNAGINANTFAAFAQFGNSFDGNAAPNMFFANLNNSESPKVPDTPLQKFLNTKIHIALLAILTYLFILSTPFHWNVFLVFLGWEVAEIFILRQHESSSNGIVNVLFVLAGVSPTKMNVFLKWIQLLNKVLRDVALFMFVFIFMHICRAYWYGIDLVQLTESRDPNYNAMNIPATLDDDVFEHFDL